MSSADQKKILITGGAGYIGSHTAVALLQAGYAITIIDNLSNGNRGALAGIEKITDQPVKFLVGDVRDENFLEQVFAAENFSGIIHFAALKAVDESITNRDEYFAVNVEGTKKLCAVAARHNVKTIVYSSSATVYGATEFNPIPETAPLQPTNPYGETKVACEKFLEELAATQDWHVCILRYFNPMGAHQSGLIGEHPKKPANIVPIILEVLRGVRPELIINGADYPTPDGSCVRDYIHVVDLAAAHVAALHYTENNPGVGTFNIGTGVGISVKEMVAEFEKQFGHEIKKRIGDRRPGDEAVVVGDPTRAAQQLNWHAQFGLTEMVRDTLNWFQKNPNGYNV